MVSLLEIRKLYWLAIPFAIASFLVTQGPDGNFSRFITLFVGLSVVYLVAMPLCFSSKATWHSIGHLIVFVLFSIAPFGLNSQLEEMGGILYYMVPFGIFVMVGMGALSLLIVSLIRSKMRPRGTPSSAE